MEALDLQKVLAKDEELRKELRNLSNAILEEFIDILTKHGGKVTFPAKVEWYYSDKEHSSITKLVKGFRLDKDCNVEILLEKENKPYVSLNNPYGHWYSMTRSALGTVREWAYNLNLLREAVKK